MLHIYGAIGLAQAKQEMQSIPVHSRRRTLLAEFARQETPLHAGHACVVMEPEESPDNSELTFYGVSCINNTMLTIELAIDMKMLNFYGG